MTAFSEPSRAFEIPQTLNDLATLSGFSFNVLFALTIHLTTSVVVGEGIEAD